MVSESPPALGPCKGMEALIDIQQPQTGWKILISFKSSGEEADSQMQLSVFTKQ